MQGQLYIITAASGAGKTSLVKALLKLNDQLKISVSHTTRAPRVGEVDGVDYHFVSDATFLTLLDAGQFLECADVHGRRYGTSKMAVDDALQTGQDVILEIDWQGAAQVRKSYPKSVSIFILPPSITALEERLNNRGQDSAEVIALRVAAARDEMRHVSEFDYVTINDSFDIALQDLRAIICSHRLRAAVQLEQHAALLQSLT